MMIDNIRRLMTNALRHIWSGGSFGRVANDPS